MMLEPIAVRRSHFSFSGEPVMREQLLLIFKAATLAPSGGNNQPWRYYFGIHGTEGFTILLDCLDEGNQLWARNAGALVLSAAQMKYTYKDKVFTNSHAWHDTGLANSLLMLQAVADGIQSHPMGGFSKEKARNAANLDKDTEPVVMIALGYPGPESNLTADLVKRQTATRLRKPLEDVVIEL